jgi:hypothetical protein
LTSFFFSPVILSSLLFILHTLSHILVPSHPPDRDCPSGTFLSFLFCSLYPACLIEMLSSVSLKSYKLTVSFIVYAGEFYGGSKL